MHTEGIYVRKLENCIWKPYDATCNNCCYFSGKNAAVKTAARNYVFSLTSACKIFKIHQEWIRKILNRAFEVFLKMNVIKIISNINSYSKIVKTSHKIRYQIHLEFWTCFREHRSCHKTLHIGPFITKFHKHLLYHVIILPQKSRCYWI